MVCTSSNGGFDPGGEPQPADRAVRTQNDSGRRAQMVKARQRERPAIRAILQSYGVPLVD